jgi:hypothetical protein
VAKQTGKGSRHQRRVSALERKATHRREFVGDADAERAEAEFRKHERVQAEENQEAVREMAAELEQAAGIKGDGAIGPEFPLRIPRTLDEAKEIARDVPEKLREKARERMGKLPEPAKQALRVTESAVAVLFVPIRLGFQIAREAFLLPFNILRSLRQREV